MAESKTKRQRGESVCYTGTNKLEYYRAYLAMLKEEGERAKYLSPFYFYDKLAERFRKSPQTIKIYITEMDRLERKKEEVFSRYQALINKKFKTNGIVCKDEICEHLASIYNVKAHSIKAYVDEIMIKKMSGN